MYVGEKSRAALDSHLPVAPPDGNVSARLAGLVLDVQLDLALLHQELERARLRRHTAASRAKPNGVGVEVSD